MVPDESPLSSGAVTCQPSVCVVGGGGVGLVVWAVPLVIIGARNHAPPACKGRWGAGEGGGYIVAAFELLQPVSGMG
jgi:hypothetical protein